MDIDIEIGSVTQLSQRTFSVIVQLYRLIVYSTSRYSSPISQPYKTLMLYLNIYLKEQMLLGTRRATPRRERRIVPRVYTRKPSAVMTSAAHRKHTTNSQRTMSSRYWTTTFKVYLSYYQIFLLLSEYFYLRLGAWVITAIVVGSLFGLIFCCIIPGYCVFKHLRK